MEKNTILGELLYIGFVCEKGRCKSSGIWKPSYIKSVKKNLFILKSITECMQNEFDIENDNMLLKNICVWSKRDKLLRRIYPLDEIMTLFARNKNIITECNKKNEYSEIVCLIDKMLEDVQIELNKKFRKDKKLIKRLLFALHNLPRVYLNTDDLLMSHISGIDSPTAIEYCKSWMDASMLQTYRDYLG